MAVAASHSVSQPAQGPQQRTFISHYAKINRIERKREKKVFEKAHTMRMRIFVHRHRLMPPSPFSSSLLMSLKRIKLDSFSKIDDDDDERVHENLALSILGVFFPILFRLVFVTIDVNTQRTHTSFGVRTAGICLDLKIVCSLLATARCAYELFELEYVILSRAHALPAACCLNSPSPSSPPPPPSPSESRRETIIAELHSQTYVFSFLFAGRG